jgi:hypothetical protein
MIEVSFPPTEPASSVPPTPIFLSEDGNRSNFRSSVFFKNTKRWTKLRNISSYRCNILSLDFVTVDGFWIDDRIYWTVWYSAWLHFTIHYPSLTHTHTQLHWSLLIAASNSGHSFSSGLPNCPWPQLPASHSNSSQRLNLSSSLTNSLIHQLLFTALNSTDFTSLTLLLITFRHGPHRNHLSSLAVSNCCSENMLICKAVTRLRLSSSCFFRYHCLATSLHVTVPSSELVRAE